MRKVFPYFLFILTLLLILYSWENIKFPFNENIQIYGEYYDKKYNPLNDPIRFVLLIFIPLTVFTVAFVFFEKNILSLNPYNKNYFLHSYNTKNIKSNLNNLFIIIILILIFDFFLLDFHYHLDKKKLDYFHEGTFLSPPFNYYSTKLLWQSTVYDYGLFSNNLNSFVWSILGEQTIGSFRFSLLSLQLLNKILLVFISKLIVDWTNFSKETKTYFFLALAFGAINLVRYKFYWVSFFPYRHCLFLIFLIFVIYFFRNQSLFRSFVIGCFSSISLLWFLDIGFFINVLILFLLIYFLIIKKYFVSISILLGAIFSWLVIIYLFPSEEISEAIRQYNFIYSVSPYLLGLEYLKPFRGGLFDWYSKPYVFFYSSFFLLIYLSLKKNININNNTKIILWFLFISSIVLFQSALVRSSDKHIIYSMGMIIFLLYFCLLYFFFLIVENIDFLYRLMSFFYTKKLLFVSSLFIIIFVFLFRLDLTKLNNLQNSLTNLNTLLFAKDEFYLEKDYGDFIKIYKDLTKTDTCVQSLYDDLSLPYLLKKPTCTKYYASTHILNGWSDDEFIEIFQQNSPEYLLYDGPYQILTKKQNMIKVDAHIKENYSFYLNFKNWIIYKKN